MEIVKKKEQLRILEAEEKKRKEGKKVKKSAAKKVSVKHKIREMWKWAAATYIMAWGFSIASIISFGSVLYADQMCQTALIYGTAIWRTIFIILSVFISPFALVIELFLNKIPIHLVQIFFTLTLFAVYVGWVALQSKLTKDTVYG